MSKFTPVDETEYRQRNVLLAGWYPATISDAPDGCVEKLSKNGNLMFETKFQVFTENGSMRMLTSYIMADGKAAFQLRSAAEAFDVLEQYKAGTLSEEDMKGKSGYVKVAVQSDPDGVYDDKNVIRDFKKSAPGTIKASDVPKPTSTNKASEDLDDGIPF